MDRRMFLAGFTGGLLAAPLVARAQPVLSPSGGPWRVGILFQTSEHYVDAILQGFRELGYVEGRHLKIEVRSAAGDLTRLAQLAHELVQVPVDVVMTPGSGIGAAMAATAVIPIVMLSSIDPVGQRQVQSISRPGGNVTGMTITFDTVLAKELQILKAAAPQVSRVGILTQSSTPPSERTLTAPQLDLTVFHVPFDSAAQLDAALATVARERADALVVDATEPNMIRRREITEFALRHRLPSVTDMKEIAEAGGLLAYVPDYFDMFRRAPRYVDLIFKGARPGDLPVQQNQRWGLFVNLKTAKALGLTIPHSLLLRADRVIE